MQPPTFHISFIIPVLNEADNIESFLLNLQTCRAEGHEIIVVDGQSSDDTVTRARLLCDKLVVCSSGRARQMNRGADQAQGDLLVFLHADTRLPETGLAELVAACHHSDRVWGRFDVSLSGHHPFFKLIAWMMNLRSRLSGIATGDQCMFVRRAVFKKIGGFPLIPLMEDITLSRTLLQLSRPICIRSRVITSSRRWEQNGILRTVLLMWYLRLAYFLGKPPEDLAQLYQR